MKDAKQTMSNARSESREMLPTTVAMQHALAFGCIGFESCRPVTRKLHVDVISFCTTLPERLQVKNVRE